MTAEIKSFVSTSKCYILSIDNTTYISYVDTNGVNTLCAEYANKTFYNLYPLSSVVFHGIAARLHKYPYIDAEDYLHIYTPKLLSDINFIQTYDTIYGLRDASISGHCYANDELFDWLARDNGYSFPHCHEILTMLYKKDRDLNNEVSGYSVSAVMSGIEYNSIYEIPGNLPNNYYSGTIFATTIKTKNLYNAKYDMAKPGTDTDTTFGIKNGRTYTGIHKCNNQIYLTYTDNKHYNTNNGIDVTVPKVGLNTNSDVANTFKCYACTATSDSTATCNFPQIEVIDNINRGICLIPHKTSLYSLQLKTSFLDKITFDANTPQQTNINKIKENLKQEIKNCMRTFAEKLAPANTLIFSIDIS